MSLSGGTPSASSAKAPNSGCGSSSVEPSPASTFGGSAASNAGSETPRTPGGDDPGLLMVGLAGVSLNSKNELANSVIEKSSYTSPFLRDGTQTLEDPFTSPVAKGRGSSHATPTRSKGKGRALNSDNWRSGSSSGSGSGQLSPSIGQAIRNALPGHSNIVGASELGDGSQVLLTAEDAQAIYPPSCCVFVANLLQSESDLALEAAVTKVFRDFGSVWVKIRRDAKQMPFAFCQFSNSEDASRAIREGRGRMINGRPCRCEKAKAHRLFFIERKYGPTITVNEAREMLSQFGSIDFIRPATPFECSTFDLNEGVMAQFDLYDDGQAALYYYRFHDVYKMQSMANMATGRQGHKIPAQMDVASQEYLWNYAIDRNSVFVGNLPFGTTQDWLESTFQQHGPLVRAEMHVNESTVEPNRKHCFAFIQYAHQASVPGAIKEYNGMKLGNKIIRVAQKDSEKAKQRALARRAASSAPAPAPEPTSAPVDSSSSASHHSINEQSASLMDQMSPPAYNSPYAYGYGNPYYGYGYGYPSAYPDPQGQYLAPSYGYSPAYNYTGSPSYSPGDSSSSAAVGNPATHSVYGFYPTFASSSTYWNGPQTYYPPTPHSPAEAQPMAGNVTQDDRSATPTPAGNTEVAESSNKCTSEESST